MNIYSTDVIESSVELHCSSFQYSGIECRPPHFDTRSVVLHGGRRFQYLDRVVYTCRMGLVPATSPMLTCTETGEWDHDPRCVGQYINHCLFNNVVFVVVIDHLRAILFISNKLWEYMEFCLYTRVTCLSELFNKHNGSATKGSLWAYLL